MTRLTFHLIPHTHWDREWYLPHGALLARFVPAMDELVERLESGDPPTFLLDGQTVLIEDYLRVRPEQEDRLAALVGAGRLQVGPWYVLADEQIPSGEALIRNLQLGARDADRLGGGLGALYSPDAFGHPPALPTLAREFGLRVGALWRGYGGSVDAGPGLDLFRWRGPDGGEVTVYHLPPEGYEVGAALPAEAGALRRAWPSVRERLVRRAATSHVGLFVGADHHRVHASLAALQEGLQRLEPGHVVRVSSLTEFLGAAAEEGRSAPIVTGELRWSYGYTWTLQGVHATRASQKRENSDLELLLERVGEPLAALAWAHGGSDRRPLLRHTWRTLVRNQFHDTLGGCCSDEVAGAAEQRAVEVRAMGREIARGAWDELTGHDPDLARDRPETTAARLWLWNAVPRPRRGVVVADLTFFVADVPVGPPAGRPARRGPGAPPFGLRAADGTAVPLQVLHRSRAGERVDATRHYPDYDEVEVVRVALEVPRLDGFGMTELRLGPPSASPPADGVAPIRGGGLSNGLVEVGVARDGTLTLREAETGGAFRGLLALESEADLGDTYTFSPGVGRRARGAASQVVRRVTASGPLVGAVEADWSLIAGDAVQGEGPGSVSAGLRVILHRGSPIVRCVLALDNQARNHRLRLRFPLGLHGSAAVAGTAFGRVTRPPLGPLEPALHETPVAAAPAHRFVAVAGGAGARGLAVLAPGFFEYELTASGDLLVTVLRAVGALSLGDLPTRPGHAGWPTPTPGAQSLGADRVLLALVPVTAADIARPGVLESLWEDVATPVHARWARAGMGDMPTALAITLEGEALVYSACKPSESEDALVLRCYNAGDRASEGRWRFARAASAAWRARADESERRPQPIGPDGMTVDFRAAPHELITMVVRFHP